MWQFSLSKNSHLKGTLFLSATLIGPDLIYPRGNGAMDKALAPLYCLKQTWVKVVGKIGELDRFRNIEELRIINPSRAVCGET